MADPNKEFLRKLLATFRVEAEEHLQDIVANIVLLEQASDAAQGDFVQRILRTLHTLKGAARAVNLAELEALCHAMEGVLSAVRKSAGRLAPEQFDILHQAGGLARQLVNEPSGKTRNQATALTVRLDRLSMEIAVAEKDDLPAPAFADSVGSDAVQPSATDIEAIDPVSVDAPAIMKTDVIRVQGKNLDAIRYQAEALLTVELGLQHHIAELQELADELADQRERMRITDSGNQRAVQNRQRASSRANSDDIGVELQCRRLAGALSRTRRNFVAIRSRLMDATLETALVPFASALDQLPAMVRNLARSRGKEAVLSIDGESIRIDRRILNVVREALMHLVTNAVDHGIETVERRQAIGKPATGEIRIEVRQRGSNRITLIVADDGVGIDVAAVTRAAVKSGNLNADQLAGLDEQRRLQFALHAGVSTSVEVTEVSGRGMGLAVVADKVASVGGDLQIGNSRGAGCSFELSLPVRLATLKGLVVRTGGARHVLPLSGIEAVRALKDGDIRTVENRETLLAGTRVLPAIRLGQLLGLQSAVSSPSAGDGVAVIARASGNTFALLVDEIVAEQEVLPKSLGKQLRRVRCITGATQLGDGSLVPILGLEDMAKYGLAAGNGAAPAARGQAGASAARHVLVVEDSITSRLLLKHLLEGAGYRVATAVDGLEALSKLRQDDFDAVVSDVEMPQMDGFALTESIRGNPKTEDLPVVLVTSLQSPAEKERGLRAGADAYIVKGSFDQDNLLATIRRLI